MTPTILPGIVLPGIGGSGPEHWQTHWERCDPAFTRFSPSSWDRPVLDDWLRALDAAVAAAPDPPVLVAHSLACLLVLHWAMSKRRQIVRGAFLVAVPDPSGPQFPRAEAPEFARTHTARTAESRSPLPFPTLMIASEDDPYASMNFSTECARGCGAELIAIGRAGHINAASGLGSWPEGRRLLAAFSAGVR